VPVHPKSLVICLAVVPLKKYELELQVRTFPPGYGSPIDRARWIRPDKEENIAAI